jgi:hypothetical protein
LPAHLRRRRSQRRFQDEKSLVLRKALLALLLLLLDAYGDALDHVLPKLFLLDGYCKVAFTDAS